MENKTELVDTKESLRDAYIKEIITGYALINDLPEDKVREIWNEIYPRYERSFSEKYPEVRILELVSESVEVSSMLKGKRTGEEHIVHARVILNELRHRILTNK